MSTTDATGDENSVISCNSQ